MKEIDLKDFDNFYSKELEPKLIKLEEERKKVWFDYIKAKLLEISLILSIFVVPIIIILLLFLLLILIGLYLSMFVKNYTMTKVFNTPILTIICFLIYAVWLIAVVVFSKKSDKAAATIQNYPSKLKTKIYTELFNLLDIKYLKRASTNFADYENVFNKYFHKRLCHWFEFKYEDYFSGVYKEIPFELCDTKILQVSQGDHKKNKTTIFRGLLLAVKINKNFDKETVIMSNNFKLFKINKEDVKLEDIEFPKYFKVYTDDQIEARYLLTPSFMERLKNYHKSKNDQTIIFFDSKVSSISNMFILTNTGKDNFEIPFNKSILNKEYYYNLIQELINMLEIASTLKLEQNIGL